MKKQIESIHARNRRVELDKAWETSKTRRSIIAIITYLFAVIFLIALDAPKPFLNALVPVVGFLLSTLSLPFFKRFWIQRQQ